MIGNNEVSPMDKAIIVYIDYAVSKAEADFTVAMGFGTYKYLSSLCTLKKTEQALNQVFNVGLVGTQVSRVRK